ncbi:MAG: tetratricopeptide repeat protein [Hydrogenophaga sp.]
MLPTLLMRLWRHNWPDDIWTTPEKGDPRYAGRALAALQAWPVADTAPDEIELLLATLQHFLHDFDTAATNLERWVKRQPRNAQAWLTLATVRRVQGRFEASNRACDGIRAARADFYARACRAENDSLRGDSDGARADIDSMLAAPGMPTESRNWVLTTLAESEARAVRADKAETAYRQAVAEQPDAYTATSYADILLERKRPREALAQLKGQQRTDAVLLRLAIADTQAGAPQAKADAQEMGGRIVAASLRPEARTTHARELTRCGSRRRLPRPWSWPVRTSSSSVRRWTCSCSPRRLQPARTPPRCAR